MTNSTSTSDTANTVNASNAENISNTASAASSLNRAELTTRAAALVAQMTVEEKASLASGFDFWHTEAIERLGIPVFMLTDGPHGVRKQNEGVDHLGINQSAPATCFPPACATACSFDRDLLHQIGSAIGEECRQEEVTVLLGPGLNIKRSPLCGRNFEYFSEDPLLSGEMAAAFINGVQSQQVGACPKHFALNNQEANRMVADSVVDERAKREIYYGAFEAVVKRSDPWMIMCSYNRIDGIYACENEDLLTRTLRDEWGFTGAVVTDWCAMDDRVASAVAGLDLQMPADGGYNDKLLVQAVREGKLDESVLDTLAERMVKFALTAADNAQESHSYDVDAHHTIARTAAAESCVLLKNDEGLLPVSKDARLAVIGQFAKTPRYQGAGSSIINPTKLQSVVETLDQNGIAYEYADGYSLEAWSEPDAERIEEACRVAKDKDVVLLFVGLPAEYESEGYDRITLDMPKAHNQLIEAVCATNPRTVVVLQLGAPVVMPWQSKVPSILLTYLGGQAGGSGCVDVLFGAVNPSGHLSESWPLALSDTPCYTYFPGNPKTVEYRESIFVGYRYYDAAERAVAWPFGHGLSYTQFEYSDIKLSSSNCKQGDTLQVSFTLTNTGAVAGADVAQLYISKKESALMRAPKELKGFEKVHLESGESATVSIPLTSQSFAYFNAPASQWAVEEGEYCVLVGASSRDICLEASVWVQGDGLEENLLALKKSAPEYFSLAPGTDGLDGRAQSADAQSQNTQSSNTQSLDTQSSDTQSSDISNKNAQNTLAISDSSFEALLGKPLPPTHRDPSEPITINSPLGDAEHTFVGKIVISLLKKKMAKMLGENNAVQDMAQAMFLEMPLRVLGLFSNGAFTPPQVEGLVDMMNGKFLQGIRKLRTK